MLNLSSAIKQKGALKPGEERWRKQQPAEERLRPSHGGEDERNGDERADADHVQDVGRQRAPEIQRLCG